MSDTMHMKVLNENHLEQYNELLRYAFQVTGDELTRVGWEEEEIREAKSPILEKAHVLGLFKGKQLASQIATYPLQMNVRGYIYPIGLVTGVATYPEFSGSGLISKLMHQALSDMRDKGQALSLLYPFSIPFYRHKGWELISNKMTFCLEDRQLPKNLDTDGQVSRVDVHHEDVKAVHNAFAKRMHGCLVRDSLVWEEYWRWEKDDINIAAYYDPAGHPTGYMVYLLEKDVFFIKEMVSLTFDAWKGLWNYVSAHDSMLETVKGNNFYNRPLAFWLNDSHISETVRPYMMGRIVDIEGFLAHYQFLEPLGNCSVTLHISDTMLDWNNRSFTIAFENGQAELVRSASTAYEASMDLGSLTTLLMGYQSASYLRTIERLDADDATIQRLDSVISKEKAYISDYI